MQAYPHIYKVYARGPQSGEVEVGGHDLAPIATHSPPEFDGPGGYWSPETLLMAAVADCFVLSFRAVARASRFEWKDLGVEVEGRLERVDGVTRFTHLRLVPRLTLANEADSGRAPAILDKAKRTCLVSNSLNAEVAMELPPDATPAGAPA